MTTTPTPGVGQVHVTPERLQHLATRSTDVADNIADELRKLLDQIHMLSGTGMAGAANVALQNSSEQLGRGLNNVTQALSGLAEKISTANTRIATEDQDAAHLISTAGGQVGDQSVINALRG